MKEKDPTSRIQNTAELLYMIAILAAILFLPVQKILGKQNDQQAAEQPSHIKPGQAVYVSTAKK